MVDDLLEGVEADLHVVIDGNTDHARDGFHLLFGSLAREHVVQLAEIATAEIVLRIARNGDLVHAMLVEIDAQQAHHVSVMRLALPFVVADDEDIAHAGRIDGFHLFLLVLSCARRNLLRRAARRIARRATGEQHSHRRNAQQGKQHC